MTLFHFYKKKGLLFRDLFAIDYMAQPNDNVSRQLTANTV